MKLLLTSQSISNPTIEAALRELMDSPSDRSRLVYITTSQNGAVGDKSWFVQNLNSVFALGWKSFELIDLASMVDLPKAMWWDRIQKADVLFMGGGANYYLSYWLERSGLAKHLPELLESTVYVGSSAGSIAVTQSLRTGSEALRQLAESKTIDLASLGPKGQSSPHALKLVNFELRPHYKSDNYPFITDALLQKLANVAGHPLYAIDDNSALKVDGESIEAISEGKWHQFVPQDAWLG